jgi:hypothetical protein
VGGALSSIFGSGIMLQARRSWVRFPMMSLDFTTDLILSANMTLGLTEPLAEMSTRNLPKGKGQPAHKGGNLTVICESLSRKCESLNISQAYGPPPPDTGRASYENSTFMWVVLLCLVF